MNTNIDSTSMNIVVIGQSRAGKSTWISSLFEGKVCKKLKEITSTNDSGQTKISVFYRLVDPTEAVELHLEEIILKEEKQQETENFLHKIENSYGIKIFNEQEDLIKEHDFIICTGKGLREIDAYDFLKKYMNNNELDKTIDHVVLSGPANEQVWRILEEAGLSFLTVRDSRGFIDESLEHLNEYAKRKKQNEKEKNNDEEYVQSLLAERGILGADACIFMSQGGDCLANAGYQKMYGGMIKETIMQIPTFLVARSNIMRQVLEKHENEKSYAEMIASNLGDNGYDYEYDQLNDESCFDEIHSLFEQYGFFESKNLDIDNYESVIRKKHYKELFLANVNKKRQKENKELYERLYLISAYGVLREAITSIKEYREDVCRAAEFLEKIGMDIFSRFKPVYDEHFKSSVVRYDKGIDSRLILREKVIEIAEQIAYDDFRGGVHGMVGPRGGITTRIESYGIVGKFAAAILESAYIEMARLITDVIESIDFGEALREAGIDASEQEIENLKADIRRMMTDGYKRAVTSYSCTGCLLKQYALEDAWAMTKSADQDEEGHDIGLNIRRNASTNWKPEFGRYLPELFELYPDDQWKKNECYRFSAVKLILWYILKSYLDDVKREQTKKKD